MPSVRFYGQVKGPACRGEEFVADILIDAPDAAINAAQGTLRYDPAQLKPVAVRYGNSILRYWVQQPALPKNPGEIPFAGGLPYPGYTGTGGPIMSIVFRVEGSHADTAVSFAQNTQAILNDGRGTAADASVQNMVVELVERESEICASNREDVFEDTTPPEPFDVIITRSDKAFGGEYFAVFDTVDKGTGIDRYEVHESSLYQSTPWLSTVSPYHLWTQSGNVLVEVRAIDGAGNTRTASASLKLESLPEQFGAQNGILILSALVVAAVIFAVCRRTYRN